MIKGYMQLTDNAHSEKKSRGLLYRRKSENCIMFFKYNIYPPAILKDCLLNIRESC
jgi:hypothetical protein